MALSGVLPFPIGAVLMAGCPAYVSYAVLALAGFMIMALSSVYTIQIMSYIQITAPQDMVGKVIAWIIAVSTCAQPAGQMLYGFLFDQMADALHIIFYTAAVMSVLLAWYSKKISGELL